MAVRITDLVPTEEETQAKKERSIMFKLKVSFPAKVTSVNKNGTVNIQPVIREKLLSSSNRVSYVNLPIIPNVPICWPSAGGYSITFPINIGDECLAVISDQSFDNWWLYGGVQNPIEYRRHDLTDAIAIFGPKSIPNTLPGPQGLTLRGPKGKGIEILKDGSINILSGTGASLVIKGDNITAKVGSSSLQVTAEGVVIKGKLTVDDIEFKEHKHTAPLGGGETSGVIS